MALDVTISGAASDSYGTLSEFQVYALAMGWTLTATDAAQEASLRRGALYLDRSYVWIGRRATSTQARQWPRYAGRALVDGYYLASDVVPIAIRDAQFELAYIALGGTDLFATVDVGAVSSTKVKVDVIEESTTYKNPSAHPRFTAIDGLVAPYAAGSRLHGGFGSAEMVR